MRRSAAWIVLLGGALGIFGCAPVTAPTLAPSPDSMPAGVAVVVPDSSSAPSSGAASDAQAPARSTPERFAGPSRDNAPGPQPAAPKLRVEPAIGVTVMRLVHDDDGAQSAAVSETSKPRPGVYEAGNETSAVPLNGPAGDAGGAEKSADASNTTAGRSSQSSGANDSDAHAFAAGGGAVSATTSGGAQISFAVGDQPAGGTSASAADASAIADAHASALAHPSAIDAHASKDAQASADAHASDDAGAGSDARAAAGASAAGGGAAPACDVKVLHEKPKTPAREVATFKLDGDPGERDQIMSLLKRRACEAGANALLLRKPDSAAAAPGAYHVEAVALLVESAKPAERKPAPKTIEVPPPSKAAPKTIEVDPDAPR